MQSLYLITKRYLFRGGTADFNMAFCSSQRFNYSTLDLDTTNRSVHGFSVDSGEPWREACVLNTIWEYLHDTSMIFAPAYNYRYNRYITAQASHDVFAAQDATLPSRIEQIPSKYSHCSV
jgi:hypothetical protein